MTAGPGRAVRAPTRRRPAAIAAALPHVLTLVLALVLTLPHGQAAAAGQRCPDTPTTVTGGTAADVAAACAVDREVRAFFRTQLGLAADAVPVRLVFVTRLDGPAGPASGCYLPADGVARVLAYDAPGDAATWRRVHPSRAFHTSVVAHEIAHALADTLLADRLTFLGAEFLAYTVGFAVLDEGVRDEVMERYGARPFADRSHVNGAVYAIMPDVFGVRAYQTWLTDPGILDDLATGRFAPALDAPVGAPQTMDAPAGAPQSRDRCRRAPFP